MCTIKPNTYS